MRPTGVRVHTSAVASWSAILRTGAPAAGARDGRTPRDLERRAGAARKAVALPRCLGPELDGERGQPGNSPRDGWWVVWRGGRTEKGKMA
eukprot:scaffold65962_cov25-Tisochrysis_lutea.AAC.2